ncbi:hypothetical protein FE257_008039 [Aspergillus nanangensis]|uniref:Uncharacterized protein n=1 Tax=Aspergillus nanangensis TaxID=2582783 RepID=A0AAD4GTU2_ASPNN|nr:hypothetical protein FE257_008039 [Aspergillus nanangensis]
MSPKRASTPQPNSEPASKKVKPTPTDTRWSKVSASANASNSYKDFKEEDLVRAYTYVCMCKPPYDEDTSEDEDDPEQESDKGDAVKPHCDYGKTCLCDKPATEHPDHPWVITNAAKQKYLTARIMCDLRCPDMFDIYTFNDHAGYGVVEVVQNLVLDFVEAQAQGDWKEQWVICAAMSQFATGGSFDPIMMVDDGRGLMVLLSLVGRMFLSMLATLKEQKLLQPGSEIKDLAQVMTSWIELIETWEIKNYDEEEEEVPDFRAIIWTYAKTHGITLPLESKFTDTLEEVGELPAGKDPWRFAAIFKEYQRVHARSYYNTGKKARIGGDSLDITTWSSAARKEGSFTGKDPLGKKEMDAIKDGMVLQLA